MIESLLEALRNSILITGLVMIMMILIEYVNIHTQGNTFRKLKNSPVKQVIVAALLGLIPGCVGGFAVVSLFTHKLLSFGSLVAMMIASSGDEAFVLLALIPKTAVILFAVLFVIGIVVGIVVDKFYKKDVAPFNSGHYQLHEDCCSTHISENHSIFEGTIVDNLHKPSRERILIIAGIAIFIIAVVFGLLEHEHMEHAHSHDHSHFDIFNERWINLIFAGISLLTLILTLRANDHFIKEHLWNHVVKKHLKSIFLWTFGALLLIHFGLQFLHIEEWIVQNVFIMILIAAAIGLIPESGPHLVFITLFISGLVPFSVLLTSSIVQDGHTTLPLLAESKKSFVKAKLINLAVGLILGFALHLFGL